MISSGGPARGILSALCLGDASSFAAHRDARIPKVPVRCVSALCRPLTFPPLPSPHQSHLISTSGGTMRGRARVASHYPHCPFYQCPVIKMSPFNFRSVALLSTDFFSSNMGGGRGGGQEGGAIEPVCSLGVQKGGWVGVGGCAGSVLVRRSGINRGRRGD